MRRWGLAGLALMGAGAACAAEQAPVSGSVSLNALEALSSRESSYAVSDHWSVDIGRDAGAPAQAFVPGRAIDDPQPRARLTLSLNLAPGARVQPYIGAGVENTDYERLAPGKPYEPGQSRLMDFAATVVAGFDMAGGDGWTMKFKADAKKVGFGMRYTLN